MSFTKSTVTEKECKTKYHEIGPIVLHFNETLWKSSENIVLSSGVEYIREMCFFFNYRVRRTFCGTTYDLDDPFCSWSRAQITVSMFCYSAFFWMIREAMKAATDEIPCGTMSCRLRSQSDHLHPIFD